MELTALESSDGGRIDLRRLSQVTRSSSEGDVHWLEDEGLTKKKKKKKKKRRSVTCGSNDSDGGTREVLESRFEEALDCARKGSAARINVSDCHLHDASIRRLMEALKANQVLTHLDISRNDITDDGAQAIAATLGSKLSLPGLSLLDVRQTRLSPDGCAILAGVMRVRKELRVEMDLEEEQLQPEREAAVAPQAASAPEAVAAEEEAGSEAGTGQEVELLLGRELKSEDPELLAEESWQQVEGALKLSPDCSQALPAVSAALRRVVVGLEEEISGLKLPLQLQHLSQLMPHLRSAMQHLPLLLMVLDMVPPSRATSYDITPQPAVGSHRLQASTIVTFLVQIGTDITDRLLVESGLVPRLVHICMTHPNNSSLQCSVLRMLMAGFESPVEQLWSCLLLPNLGLQPGAAACCENEIQPLHRLLAAHCLEAQSRAFGRRSPLSGFAITLAQEMRSLCHETEEQHGNDTLKSMLEADLQWQELVEEGGPLDILTSQQQGCLGGVRPKAAADEAVEDDMAQLVTAMGMSRREIVSMLQGSGPALSPEFEP